MSSNTASETRDRSGCFRFCRQRRQLSAGVSSRSEEWRRERDSNPRWSFPHSGFQDHRHRPLGHPSAPLFYSEIRQFELSCPRQWSFRPPFRASHLSTFGFSSSGRRRSPHVRVWPKTPLVRRVGRYRGSWRHCLLTACIHAVQQHVDEFWPREDSGDQNGDGSATL
jgi:hypothetical protein